MNIETRRAAAALLLLVPVPSLGVLAGMSLLPGSPSGAILFFAAKLWVFLLPAAWRRFVDRQPASLSPMRRGGLRAGLLSGVVMAAAIVAAYLLLGERLIERSAVIAKMADIGLGKPAVFLATAAYWILVNSVLEEYVWRWFVVRKGEVLVGPGRAVILSAAGFTLHHALAMSLYFPPWRPSSPRPASSPPGAPGRGATSATGRSGRATSATRWPTWPSSASAGR